MGEQCRGSSLHGDFDTHHCPLDMVNQHVECVQKDILDEVQILRAGKNERFQSLSIVLSEF